MTEPTNREDLTAFFGIAHRWQLDSCDQAVLLGVDQPELESFPRDSDATALSDETLERLRQLMRIDAGLQILLPLPERADSWVHQPNAAPVLEGESVLSYMLRGRLSDLRDVANHVAAHRSGDFS